MAFVLDIIIKNWKKNFKNLIQEIEVIKQKRYLLIKNEDKITLTDSSFFLI